MTDAPEKRKPAGTAAGAKWKRPRPRREDQNLAIEAALMRPGATVSGVARELGVTRQRVMRVRDGKKSQQIAVIRQISAANLAAKFETFADVAMDNLLDRDLSGENARNLIVAAGVAVDKANLLRGLPTQIISNEDRRALPEAMKVVMQELERRGLAGPKVVEGEFVEVTKEGGDGA